MSGNDSVFVLVVIILTSLQLNIRAAADHLT